MVLHIFALRWKPEATQTQKIKALSDIQAFQAAIPGILELHVGPNLSSHSQGFETVGVLRFAGQAALETYLAHPVHQAFVRSVAPVIEAVDLDLHI